MRWSALITIGVAAFAIFLVVRGDSELRIHRLIVAALGVGVCVLIGSALMYLVVISRMGRGEDTGHR